MSSCKTVSTLQQLDRKYQEGSKEGHLICKHSNSILKKNPLILMEEQGTKSSSGLGMSFDTNKKLSDAEKRKAWRLVEEGVETLQRLVKMGGLGSEVRRSRDIRENFFSIKYLKAVKYNFYRHH